MEIVVPEAVWQSAERATPATIGVGWGAAPAARASIALGTRWAASQRSALLLVPSVIVPEENNLLINPAHPQSARVTARKVRKWLYDSRMVDG